MAVSRPPSAVRRAGAGQRCRLLAPGMWDLHQSGHDMHVASWPLDADSCAAFPPLCPPPRWMRWSRMPTPTMTARCSAKSLCACCWPDEAAGGPVVSLQQGSSSYAAGRTERGALCCRQCCCCCCLGSAVAAAGATPPPPLMRCVTNCR